METVHGAQATAGECEKTIEDPALDGVGDGHSHFQPTERWGVRGYVAWHLCSPIGIKFSGWTLK